MKVKSFAVNSGEYAVVAEYVTHNDAAESDEMTTIRTHERPRGRFFNDLATLALAARVYHKLGELPLTISKITFTENDDGHFVKLYMETTDPEAVRVTPPRVKRQQIDKAGEDEPDPENPKNIYLEAVDQVENRITEYLGGDREQPLLIPKPEASPAEKKQKRFAFGKRG